MAAAAAKKSEASKLCQFMMEFLIRPYRLTLLLASESESCLQAVSAFGTENSFVLMLFFFALEMGRERKLKKKTFLTLPISNGCRSQSNYKANFYYASEQKTERASEKNNFSSVRCLVPHTYTRRDERGAARE